ncbi:MAG: hypothetical protein NTU63_03835 [Candidatus Pacearchaeota archaeon]|nr:hypothetical protein [Candidatus Pacearchaeota archaeon]
MEIDRLLDPNVTEFYNGIMITGPRSWVNKQVEMQENDPWSYVDYNGHRYIGPKSFIEKQMQFDREFKRTGQFLFI